MSDSFSIAMVTSALFYRLSKEGITVSARSPDSMTDADKQVNIFLYQVTPNLGYRGMDLPARDYAGSSMVTKQQLGLDLHYLITVYGEKDKDELAAHKLMGEVTRLFNDNPVLTRDFLQEIITEANAATPTHLPDNVAPDIRTSDLVKQLELVKLTMQSMSLEDMTKLWSSFFKTGSYRLSVVYKATVVLIDGKHEPSVAMPVRARNVYAIAPKNPEIMYVDPQVAKYGSATTVRILGKNLAADSVRIDFGEGKKVLDMPEAVSVSDEELVADISSLQIGVHQVRAIHPLLIGTPEFLHKGPESDTAFFAITPAFTHTPNPVDAAVVSGGKLTLKVDAGIKVGQKVQVILGTQKEIPVTNIASEPVQEIKVDLPSGINPGTYPVRIRVDGAETQPDGYFGEYMRPTVVVP